MNDVLEALNSADIDLKKMSAVLEYSGNQEDPATIITLAENLDDFIFIPDVESAEDVSRHYLTERRDYNIPGELDDYFDYAALGKAMMEQSQGAFVTGGCVCMREGCDLDEILSDTQDQGIRH